MSLSMPETEEDMLKIVGVTKANFEKYGRQLLKITQEAAADKLGKQYLKFMYNNNITIFFRYIIKVVYYK